MYVNFAVALLTLIQETTRADRPLEIPFLAAFNVTGTEYIDIGDFCLGHVISPMIEPKPNGRVGPKESLTEMSNGSQVETSSYFKLGSGVTWDLPTTTS